MKNLCLFVLLSHILSPLAARAKAAEDSDKNALITNIQKIAQNDGFCRKGDFLSRITSIRSSNGSYCRDEIGASIAVLACSNWSNFDLSKCAKVAKSSGIASVDNAKQALTKMLSSKDFQAQRLCDPIAKILSPSKNNDCLNAIENYKKAKNMAPSSEYVDSGLLLPTIVSGGR